MFILFSDIFDYKIVESEPVESKSVVEDTSAVDSTKVDDNAGDYFDASIREIITADKDYDLFLEKDTELNYTDIDPSENKAVDEGLETCSQTSNQDVSDVIVQDKNNIHVASTGEKTYVTNTGKQFPIKKQSALSKTKSPTPKTVRRLIKTIPSEESRTPVSPPPVLLESKKIKSVVKRIYNKSSINNISRKETDDNGSTEKITRKRTRSRSRSRSRSSSVSDKRDKRSVSPYQRQSSSSYSKYHKSTSPDKSYSNRKDGYSYSEEDRYQQQQDYYHYHQHRQQCPKVNDTLCDLYDFQQDIQNTYRLFLRYPCLADTVLKDNQYLIAQRNKTLYENLPDIIEHCCEFKATMQLNQLTDKEKILFFRYMLQVLTLGVAYRKYVFLDAHDRVNMGQPLPDFAKMLNITDVELELMVKQMFSFAQRATNIVLPTEKECFSRQDQKQYQYKKNVHSNDNYDNQYYDSDVRFTRRGGGNNFGRFNNKRQQFHKGRGRGGGGGGSYTFYNQYPVQQSNESQKRYHDAYYTNRNNAEYTASYSTTTKYDQPSTSHQSWHNQSDLYSQKHAAYNCYGSYKTST